MSKWIFGKFEMNKLAMVRNEVWETLGNLSQMIGMNSNESYVKWMPMGGYLQAKE